MEKTYYLPAEWYKQSYIQLTWLMPIPTGLYAR